MSAASLLFDLPLDPAVASPPACFSDLHLDDIVDRVIAGREAYELKGFFHMPLKDLEAVRQRHAVFRDLQEPGVRDSVSGFAQCMLQVRRQLELAGKLYHERQRQRWFLEAANTYCKAVRGLAQELPRTAPRSDRLNAVCAYLAQYAGSAPFAAVAAEAEALLRELAMLRYTLYISGTRIRVSRYEGEADYAQAVLHTFEKFAEEQGTAKNYRFEFPSFDEMNHVETAILDRVALLFPDVFGRLGSFPQTHAKFLDDTLLRFDREVQFYLAYLDRVGELREHGLYFCFPELTDGSKELFGQAVFDVALAQRLLGDRQRVVANDFELHDPERVVIVSGPNQGGKTTFARTLGQMHYLAALGCPVPGRAARLLLIDGLFTLFERQERLENLSGKLEEELLRLHEILGQATERSVLIMNETFGATTLADALVLGRRVITHMVRRDMLCIYVTFLEELTQLPGTASMVSCVDPEDPARRTFKIMKRPADGHAYALAIARKHRLNAQAIAERIGK